jgi:hypothetical protein
MSLLICVIQVALPLCPVRSDVTRRPKIFLSLEALVFVKIHPPATSDC